MGAIRTQLPSWCHIMSPQRGFSVKKIFVFSSLYITSAPNMQYPDVYSQQNRVHICICKNVHGSIFCNSPEWVSTAEQMSTWWSSHAMQYKVAQIHECSPMQHHGWISHTRHWMKEVKPQRIYIEWVHLYKVQKLVTSSLVLEVRIVSRGKCREEESRTCT